MGADSRVGTGVLPEEPNPDSGGESRDRTSSQVGVLLRVRDTNTLRLELFPVEVGEVPDLEVVSVVTSGTFRYCYRHTSPVKDRNPFG